MNRITKRWQNFHLKKRKYEDAIKSISMSEKSKTETCFAYGIFRCLWDHSVDAWQNFWLSNRRFHRFESPSVLSTWLPIVFIILTDRKMKVCWWDATLVTSTLKMQREEFRFFLPCEDINKKVKRKQIALYMTHEKESHSQWLHTFLLDLDFMTSEEETLKVVDLNFTFSAFLLKTL